MENTTAENKKQLLEGFVRELDEVFIKDKQRELYKFIVEAVEKPLIEKILERTFGNQLKAAKILGLNRNTLRVKIKKLGINVEKWKIF